MRDALLYLLAIILPWLSVLLAGKPIQGIVSLVFWILSIFLFFTTFILGVVLWLVLVIHAFFVVNGRQADKRTQKIIAAMSKPLRAPETPRG